MAVKLDCCRNSVNQLKETVPILLPVPVFWKRIQLTCLTGFEWISLEELDLWKDKSRSSPEPLGELVFLSLILSHPRPWNCSSICKSRCKRCCYCQQIHRKYSRTTRNHLQCSQRGNQFFSKMLNPRWMNLVPKDSLSN